ncbi:TetR/AcrR family transcriptional regulator [Breoghania sp. L-A4]|nr:TetR/AcrR family transcriptional regulator [Breoghania sp. L-A4]
MKASEPKKRSNARERIIDAAISVAQSECGGKISLDAVAESAGVSKGGLLYHFASKSALLQAMIARHVDTLDEAIEAAHAQTSRDKRPNAMMRAYLLAFRVKLCSGKKPAQGFLTAIAEEPALLDPVRAHHARLIAEIETKSDDPELAIMAFLAVEGIWNLRLFETSPFNETQLTSHFDSLIDLLADPPRH